MQPLQHYIYDPSFNWGHMWRGLSMEIGRPILALLVVMGALDLAVRGRCDRRNHWLLAVTFGYSTFFLQMPASGWFYLNVPGAFFLGFPMASADHADHGSHHPRLCVVPVRPCQVRVQSEMGVGPRGGRDGFSAGPVSLRGQAMEYEIYPRRP